MNKENLDKVLNGMLALEEVERTHDEFGNPLVAGARKLGNSWGDEAESTPWWRRGTRRINDKNDPRSNINSQRIIPGPGVNLK